MDIEGCVAFFPLFCIVLVFQWEFGFGNSENSFGDIPIPRFAKAMLLLALLVI